MTIHAYDEMYINSAQQILGHATDFALVSLGLDADAFETALTISRAAKQFEDGNPRYVAGMNGCEFARIVLTQTGNSFPDIEDEMFLDKSPEYWSGWALAFYQWYSCKSFEEIFSLIHLSDVIGMYPVFHEMDIMRFVEKIDSLSTDASSDTRLKIRRLNCGLSQSELAKISGVALRQIQLFEQRQRNINNASAVTLFKLGKALSCSMDSLLEPF